MAAGGVLGLAGCTTEPTPSPPEPHVRSSSADATAPVNPEPTHTAAPNAFDRTAHSIDDATSLWVVVNKSRPLKSSFIPATVAVSVPHTNPPLLRKAASAAVVTMFAAARADGVHLASNSTYRSYADQQSVYDGNLNTLGRARADHLSAHPGCSEHQTGLAIDIGPQSGRCSLNTCMGDLPEGKWLAQHAWKYGFLLRYPEDQVSVTGYQYEPWHFRYLGHALATELHKARIPTLEQFFNLPAAPDYT